MSSSSSGRDPLAPCGPLQALVAESFGLLELQQSGRHRSLLEKLRGRVVCLRSGGEVRFTLWVDAVVLPEETRAALVTAMEIATRHDDGRAFKTGVLQV